MSNMAKQATPTPESVWAILQELAESQKETDRILRENELQMQETDRRMQETDRQMKETDRQMKETDRQMQDTDRRMKELQKRVGAWDNNHGLFAEEYFFNSFENGEKNFFGEKFDEIERNIKGLEKKDEYDIVLINGKHVGIIEVKFKAHENDIPQVLNKAETFRENFPKYKNHKIYLGLATMMFYPELEQECINKGIAVIKQVGDNVVINDKHLKIF